jgi:DNA repair exonuclease SbcCD ATPase subunit
VKDYLEDLDKRIEVKRRMEKRISELEEELSLSQERLKRIEAYEKEDFQYYLPFVNKRTGKLVPMASPYYDEKRRLERKIETIKAELGTLRERLLEIKRGL